MRFHPLPPSSAPKPRQTSGGPHKLVVLFCWASVFATAPSLTEALKEGCQAASIAEKSYDLTSTTKLVIQGFKPSIRYVTVPNAPSRTIKIKAASEEPSVEFVNNELVITTSDCGSSSTTLAPSAASIVTESPTTAPTAGDVTSAAASSFSSNMILAPLLAMTLPRGAGLTVLAAHLLSMGTTFVAADEDKLRKMQVDDESCVPSLEVEVSVPYDCPFNNFVDGVCKSVREIGDMATQAIFVDFDAVAAEKLLATDYIQHNPGVPTGSAPLLGFIPALADSGLGIEVHRTIVDGNLVAYHSTYTNATLFGGDTLIGFDVYRVEDGQIQEHWDNLQELAGPSPSGNTMVDGPTMVKYMSETEANKAVATGFVEEVLLGGNATAAADYISAVTYTQHNPGVADGLDGLAEAFASFAAAGITFVYDSTDLFVAQGNFVLIGSLGEFAGDPTAYYDLFRVEDGLIVEHWDVIQSVPPPEEFAHTNGKF